LRAAKKGEAIISENGSPMNLQRPIKINFGQRNQQAKGQMVINLN